MNIDTRSSKKWAKSFVFALLLIMFLLAVAGIMELCLSQPLPDWLAYASGIVVFFMFFSGIMAQTKISAETRQSFLDFLENDAPLPSAERLSFEPAYRQEIDKITELLECHGMKWVADHHLPMEESSVSSSGKPVLARIFCNQDNTVWCVITKLSFAGWTKWLPPLRENSQAILELEVCFENGTILSVSNANLPTSRPHPQLIRRQDFEAKPEELLQICLAEKMELAKSTPAKPLTWQDFMHLLQAMAVYWEGQLHAGICNPSDRQLTREGFSRAAIEKYRELRQNPGALLFASQEGGEVKSDFKINGNPATEMEVLDFLSEAKPTAECDFISYRQEDIEVSIGWFFDEGWQLCREYKDGRACNSVRKYTPDEIIQWWNTKSDFPGWADEEQWEELMIPSSRSYKRLTVLFCIGVLLFSGLGVLSGKLPLTAFLIIIAVLMIIFIVIKMRGDGK